MLATPKTNHQGQTREQSLKIYTYYRIVLAFILVIANWSEWGVKTLGIAHPQLYLWCAIGYSAFSLLILFPLKTIQYRIGVPAHLFTLLVDIAALTLMTHATSGLGGGLGLLLITVVAAGSIFTEKKLSLLVAAMASIAIMVESIISIAEFNQDASIFLPAGLLGIVLFLTALIFRVLEVRVHTAQELAEAQSTQADQLRELNESIITRMQTGIIVVANDGDIQLINHAAIQLLGGQKLGQPLNIGQTLRTIPSLHQQLERWRDYPWMRTPVFNTANSDVKIQANFTTLEQGDSQQVLIFLEDYRTIAQHAQQLKLSSLGRLTGSIAHEIRNPLGAISHASQLLEEGGSDPSQLTNIIQRHCQRINQIVENVMQMSRQQSPKFQKIWLTPWLKTFREEYLDNALKTGVIEIDSPDDDFQVLVDPLHLDQILNNLVDNGLRFNAIETGERRLNLRFRADENGIPHIDVIDNGPGISDTNIENLFEPFYTTCHEGSGLGLYLAKALCEVNSALLSYHNNPEGGAIFKIQFPHPERLLPRTAKE